MENFTVGGITIQTHTSTDGRAAVGHKYITGQEEAEHMFGESLTENCILTHITEIPGQWALGLPHTLEKQ